MGRAERVVGELAASPLRVAGREAGAVAGEGENNRLVMGWDVGRASVSGGAAPQAAPASIAPASVIRKSRAKSLPLDEQNAISTTYRQAGWINLRQKKKAATRSGGPSHIPSSEFTYSTLIEIWRGLAWGIRGRCTFSTPWRTVAVIFS